MQLELAHLEALNNLIEGCAILDSDCRFVFVNEAIVKRHGRTREETLGRTIVEIAPGLENSASLDHIHRCQEERIPHRGINEFSRADGGTAWYDFSVQPVSGGVFILSLDITDRILALRSLEEANERWRSVVQSSPDMIMTVARDGAILFMNRTVPGFDDLLAVGTSIYSHINIDHHDAVRRSIEHVWLTGQASSYEVVGTGPDGATSWYSTRVGPLLRDGRVEATTHITTDITEQKKADDEIRRLAFHDALTGLPNRVVLNDRLIMALAQAKRNEKQLALMFLDLDEFKAVNDKVGHADGDELLQRLAKGLAGCVRASDTVARLGGDEFVILLPAIGGRDEAIGVAQRVLAGLRKPHRLADQEFRITGSIGIAMYPGDGAEPQILLRSADNAMYRAKERGKNRYQFSIAPLVDESLISQPTQG